MLETKLYVPRPRRGLVPRPRLSERLSRGTASKLTLISAPAGFGKSTLLAEWLATISTDERSVAWLSLDEADNQPARFWTYVVTALRTIAPEVGTTALSLLQGPQPPSIEMTLATLLNDLGAASGDVVLVLDDYHEVDSPEIQVGMSYLLENLPPQIHVVMTTRADPALPLGRLRGHGELTEIRAADLRFNPNEAAAYLNETMGLDLTARDVAALEARTEGWIAALQLAALSMQGRDDVAGFIAGFAGDDRYVVDYLAEEVLQRQPESVRTFLLETSVLDRLSGSLCDAVTARDGSAALLESLDRANLFLVPLDDRRRWYRYHHLFADVLRAHLQDERPDVVHELHRRASEWYEQHDERSEAIRHAVAALDYPRAADLIELSIPALSSSRQESLALAWLQALPDAIFSVRPVLSVYYAGALLLHGQVAGAETRMRAAERWLDATSNALEQPGPEMSERIVVDEGAFTRLPSMIATYRATLALSAGDVPETIRRAQAGLDLAGPDDHLSRGGSAGLLALAYWTTGDLTDALGSWAECMTNLRKAGYIADLGGCAIAVGDIRITLGQLREAMGTYERVLALLVGDGGPVLRGAADMHVGMGEVMCERNDLEAARQHLHQSSSLGEHLGLPQNAYRSRVVAARIRQADGDLAGALGLLDEAERVYVGDYSPNVRPIAARKARLLVAAGRLDEAADWARERGLSSRDDLNYLQEFEHITLARVLLARAEKERTDGPMVEATALLARLMREADDGGRSGSLIEILLLQAIADQMAGERRVAQERLGRALTMAEPEGYVRAFVEAGPPIANLLETAAKRGVASGYIQELLAAFGRSGQPRATSPDLIEALSERELEVLRLLATDLDGPDIASELVLSLNTIRTHTKNIYAKLAVNNRRAAVTRAVELDLLSRGR